jgi:hypothetical protein
MVEDELETTIMPPQAGTFAIPPAQQTIMPYPNPNHPYSELYFSLGLSHVLPSDVDEGSNRLKRKRSPKDIGGASLARDECVFHSLNVQV